MTGASCMISRMSRLIFNRRRVGRAIAITSVAAFAGAISGCAPVAPYERGKLAHPTMTAGALSTMGEEHLHAISEGATGGSGGTGSGCGCN
jgi:hypothetical protein